MSAVVTTAMVLAAGFGTRMRPLTDATPKPLIKVAGKALINHVMDRLRDDGVQRAVVNAHHLADQIDTWARTTVTPAITVSDERDVILDTGGGICRALPLLGQNPFFVMNSDSFWVDHGTPALLRLREMWNAATMDCLLLLCDPAQTTGYGGIGDFVRDSEGRLIRRKLASNNAKAMAYIGGYIVKPELFNDAPDGAFSMNLLWDRAISRGRLFGLAHEGHWLHVGTPEAIAEAEAYLRQNP